MDAGGAPGLAIREKALPNFDPFEPVPPSLVDPTIGSVRFRYMRSGGGWEETWDSTEENKLPQAIEVTLTPAEAAGDHPPPPVVLRVPIRVNAL